MYEYLLRKNIHVIPAGDCFGLPEKTCSLVYAPLTNAFFLAREEEVENLERELSAGRTEDNPVWLTLLASPEREAHVCRRLDSDSILTLYLLLNEKCNFSCRYCYSAQGRSRDELDIHRIRPMVDRLLGNARRRGRVPFIMFMGGGEPTLSWPLVEETVAYALTQAQPGDQPVHWGMSTNGSILTEEMLEFYKKHSFELQFSFDVLPEVQNEQRGSFDKVSANLRRLSDAGVYVRIRSTITALNVDRLEEMVRFCQEYYPAVKRLSCEPVVDPVFLSDPEVAETFFDAYFQSFVKAERVAEETGMAFFSSCSGAISTIRNHFCGGLYCLNPFGTVTYCPNVSSPRESDYERMIYGRVEEGRSLLDNDAYQRMTQFDSESHEECRSCFARWNCGGGCPNQRRVYRPEIFASVCRNMRRMVRHMLLDRLAQRYGEATGSDFWEAMRAALSQTPSLPETAQ